MENLTLTNNVTMEDLKKFCGEKVLFYTGDTRIITPHGNIQINIRDTIVKNDDGTFNVIKDES